MEGMELVKSSGNYSLLLMKSLKDVENGNKQHSLPMEGVTYDDKVYHKERLLPDEDMEIVRSYKNERFLPTDGKKPVDNMNSHEVSMEGQQNAGKVNQIKSLLPMDDMEIVKSYKNERFPMETEKPLEYKNNPHDEKSYQIEVLLPKEDLEVAESHKSELSLPIEGPKPADTTNSQQISMEDVQNAGKVNQIESLLPLDDMDIAESAKIASIFPRKLKKIIKNNKNHKTLSKPRDRIDNMFILHHALKNRKNTNVPQHNRSKMIESLRPTSKDNRESGTTIKYINKQPKANFDTSGEMFEKFPNLLAVNHNKDLKQMILKINERGGATMNYYPGKHLDSVCIGRSTIYNKPVVMDWLKTKIYSGCSSNSAQWTGPEAYSMWFAFRYNLFKNGRSEECHKIAFNTYRSYLECALMRNQRMEFLIPKYPLHQLGYVFMSSKSINENLYNSYTSYQPKS
ncbi:PREDICTED: uncharacterized protein LOC108609579 [Drosophila arizonae]|uniref:Uncharacterized protein LOC108609579 n=1 Tax=Drosophila arizonae TaxID=7263 RepID=A0ABM1NPA2_DROAR|nr:PREDICTED: uncharacterized protein LOC108609579 [Drosophila arizonae]